MKHHKSKSSVKVLVTIFIIITLIYFLSKWFNTTSEATIADLTDKWIYNVTVKNDPDAIYKMFCPDGNLVGTVSQVKRKGINIKKYFDYFAKLPEIKVLNKKYNISQVDKHVFVNTAFIEWTWKGLPNPIVARMTFLFRGNCLFQLHSSALPDENESLLAVSNLN